VEQQMDVRGILFDLYGTLLVYGNMQKAWSDWLSTFYHLLKEQGLNISREAFSKECDGFFSADLPFEKKDHLSALERRILALSSRVHRKLDKETLGHIADTIAQAWQTHIFLDPETIPLLRALKKNKALGLVSNFDHPPHIRRILSDNGLAGFFDTIIISSEVGAKKPDPAIFGPALQQIGLSPGQVVYVGDTAADVAGAIAAGIHPVLIDRPENPTDSDALDFQLIYRNEDLAASLSAQIEVTVISSLPEVLQITK